MAAKLSSAGLDFIASWSPYVETAFKFEDDPTNKNTYVGYSYYGSQLAYKPFNTVDDSSTTTVSAAKETLLEELQGPCFNLVKDFSFTRFTQAEFDALVSICTTYRRSDYYDFFKGTDVYTALVNKSDKATVAGLIKNLGVPTYVSDNYKRSHIFYDIATRRANEADLFENGTYTNCTGLTYQTKDEGGVKVLY